MAKKWLGAAAAFALASFVFGGNAEAACWWNGDYWTCDNAGAGYYRYNPGPYSDYYPPYPYYRNYGYGYGYGRYPGPKTNGGGY